MIRQIYRLSVLLGTTLALAAACAAAGVPPLHGVTIASGYSGKVAIIDASNDSLMHRTGLWCRDFISRQGFLVNNILAARIQAGSAPLWVLETEGNCPVAKSLGIDTSFLKTAKADAYILSVFERQGRAVVSVVGRNVVGVRSGVARLVALTKNDGSRLIVPQATERRSPFFEVRELAVSNRGRLFKGTPWADTLWRRWSDERIRKYAEQIWLMGFNSIQLIEGRNFRVANADKTRLNDIVSKTLVFMRAAHANGMKVTQWVWGQAPYDDKMCWNTPSDRSIMEEEFRWMAKTYGKDVDRVVVHVRDPGGCPRGKDCPYCDDYRTPQEVAAFIYREYRKVNPKVEIVLSTWQNPGFWKGAQGVKFLDETYMPKDIGIALHKWYDADKAKMVLSSGRTADIWSWYLSDHETTSDMSLCMRRVDKYFSSLPDQASGDIRAISTELCFHGWPNVISAYVSAQKMWSPHRDLNDIEREFCAGMFGEKNADGMVALYQACESVVNPPRYDSCLPPLSAVFGNPEYNKEFRSALAMGKKAELRPSFTPIFSTATDPRALRAYLIRNLSLVTVLSEAQEKVNVAKRSGASHAELEKIVNDAILRAEPYKIDIDYTGLLAKLKDSINH